MIRRLSKIEGATGYCASSAADLISYRRSSYDGPSKNFCALMNRRQFLKTGAAAWTTALAGSSCLRAPRRETLAPVKDLAVEWFNSLDDSIRSRVCVDYDHPLRQYHNRGVGLGGVGIGHGNFSWAQLKLLNRLFYAGLSEEGRGILPNEYFLRWTGIRMLEVLIAGDPNSPYYQLFFSGPHMNLRLGGKSREGVAFGGPMVYGDQHGDSVPGLPGNIYQYQFHQGHDVFSSLSAGQRQQALLRESPIQTQIELQGDKGVFPGLPVSDLSRESKRKTEDLIRGILKNYDAADVAYARGCLEQNGGIDSLHLSYYQDGEVAKSGQYQIFRLEGPAAAFYFRGFPHVHAFINVAMDGNRPLSVGETLGENPAVLEGAAIKNLFEAAMKERARADFAYYNTESVVGRLRAGVIRAGDVYNLESWGNALSVVSIKGSQLAGSEAGELMRRGAALESGKTYTVATTDYLAGERASTFGGGKAIAQNVLLRDVVIDYVKSHGFPRST